MAHFLLMPFGSSGDTNPFIGVGRALLKRGHRVSIFVNGHFRAAAERAGLDYSEAGSAEDYLRLLNNPDVWHPRKGFEAVVANPMMPVALRAQYQWVEERFKADPSVVVVAGSLAMGARIAQEKLGVRLVSLHLQPMMFFSVNNPPVAPAGRIPDWMPRAFVRFTYWLADRHLFGPVIGRMVEPIRGELGLPKTTRYLSEWIHSPQLSLGLFPKWFAHETDWPAQLRQTGFPLFDDGADQALPPDVEEYLRSGEAPDVYTFGSGMRVGHELFAAAADACERLGRRGILLTPFREQLPKILPPQATHFSYIPLAQLLPRAAAIVHHGGIGTMSQALRAGIPQVITPMAHDQPDNAHRIARLGAGRALPSPKVTGPTLATEVSRVLNDTAMRDRCKVLARNFDQQDAIEETCAALEAFAGTGAAATSY